MYVWQYPLRLVHWGLVISIGVLSFTGYYIHNPFIIGQTQHPFLMGWFRFVHEAFGMIFLALFLLRLYLFFGGNRWEGWRQFLPLSKDRIGEMLEVMKFYAFIRPTPVSKVGHNPMAALSYIGIYSLVLRGNRHWPGDVQLAAAQRFSPVSGGMDSALHQHPEHAADSLPC